MLTPTPTLTSKLTFRLASRLTSKLTHIRPSFTPLPHVYISASTPSSSTWKPQHSQASKHSTRLFFSRSSTIFITSHSCLLQPPTRSATPSQPTSTSTCLRFLPTTRALATLLESASGLSLRLPTRSPPVDLSSSFPGYVHSPSSLVLLVTLSLHVGLFCSLPG